MHRVLTALLILLACSTAAAQQPVRYTVDLEGAAEQSVIITMTVPDSEPGPFTFHLPVWRPGLYTLIDPAGSVRGLEVRTTRGDRLEWSKSRRSSWTVQSPGGSLAVSYELHAASLGNRTRHADDTHAFLSGSSVFLYSDVHRDNPIEVRIRAPSWTYPTGQPPSAWSVATGLVRDGRDPWLFRAANYDLLVDSPLEIGEHAWYTFEVLGVPHVFAIWGDAWFAGEITPQRLIEDTKAIVESQAEIFGGLPYDRYVFITHAGEGLGGGTEHWNSTVLSANPAVFENEERYLGFLSLIAHEVFHAWNVKRLRPAELVPYQYQDEAITSLLWFAEGTTSYYDELLLARTGIVEPDAYLDRITRVLSSAMDTPGRAVQSIEHASIDAWTKQYRPSNDAFNSRSSIYGDGAALSLCLDLYVRRDTENAFSFDDVMRALYERFPLEVGGFTRDDLIATALEITGVNLRPFLDTYAADTEPLPLSDLLASVGVRFEREDDSEGVDPGFTLRGSEIRRVTAGSPAARAGLNPGDELVAINGRKYDRSGLADLAKISEPGAFWSVHYFRFGMLRETEFAPRRARGSWTLERIEDPSEEQEAAFNAWIFGSGD